MSSKKITNSVTAAAAVENSSGDLQLNSLGSVRESNLESDEEAAIPEEIQDEIDDAVTRPLSASSTGSMPAQERPPEREFNPFVKAISS